MYKNLKQKNLGDLSSWYWSSSKYSYDLAWGQRFSSGYQDYLSKFNLGSVRAV